ncbi:hypothetical protein OJ252_2454 [Cryptosporidium canis]|uniref:Uncharacterized protein n=1 Tax=Cryptosporidium canis TaxID=195482 RepID=A0ABQ8P5N1_9CRYT|nr:hypothetical protein OJ252_2454 [Cryptosporidium canis]
MDLDSLPKSLFKELVRNRKFVHLVSINALELTGNFLDFIWDIGVLGVRGSEDRLFSNNKHLISLFRRGLSLGIRLSQKYKICSTPIKWFEYEPEGIEIWVLKRGMSKFADLPFKHDSRIEQIVSSVGSDLQGLNLLASEKLDGENSQISYLDITDQWVIGSKNVTILCSHEKDLENAFYSDRRYESVKANAYYWFQILNEFKACCKDDCEAAIGKMKRVLRDHTLLCELIGNHKRQHVINYSDESPQLYFFGIVSKADERGVCCNPLSLTHYLHPFFLKYTVKFARLPSQDDILDFLKNHQFQKYCFNFSHILSLSDSRVDFQNIHELDVYLSVLQTIVYTLGINTEGIVLYLIKSGPSVDRDVVLSVFKIKTIRFSNLRLIRESLRDQVVKNLELSSFNIHEKTKLGTSAEPGQLSKPTLGEFWASVYEQLVVLIQNNADNFFNKISNSFKAIQKQISDSGNLFSQLAISQMESELIYFKHLYLFSSIYLLSKVIHLGQKAKKIDPVQLKRYFFNSYSEFIARMETQVLNFRKITGIHPIQSIPDVDSLSGPPTWTAPSTPSVPFGSVIEILVPPLSWSWAEIKNMLSHDFSLNPETWIPVKDGIYFTGKSSNSEKTTSNCSKQQHQVFVSIRHAAESDLIRGTKQLGGSYKIYVPDTISSLPNKAPEPVLFQTVNSKKMSGLRNNSYDQLKLVVDQLNSKIQERVFKEADMTDFGKLTRNHQLVMKLEALSKTLPWEDSGTEEIFPSGYIINMGDFEHLLYAIFGSDDLPYVIDLFYKSKLESRHGDLEEAKGSLAVGSTSRGPKLESTFVLPCGIPGSGKSFLLKSLLQKMLSSLGEDSYYFSALTSGKHVNTFRMEDESVYSVIVPSVKTSSGNAMFDLILYVSRDGCAQSIMNGIKYSYNSLDIDLTAEECVDSTAQPNDSPSNLSEESFQRLSKKSKSCMSFIMEYLIKKCTGLVQSSQDGDSKQTSSSPDWFRYLRDKYKGSRNLKLLVLFDVNHTPEQLIQLSEDFGGRFKLCESTLYRVILAFTDRFGCFASKDWKFIFSKIHVILSILRMIKRTSHSTLKGPSKKNVSILLHFLVLYSQHVRFISKEGRMIKSTLSKSLLRSMGYKEVIVHQNKDEEFLSCLDGRDGPILDSLLTQLSEIASSIDTRSSRDEIEVPDQFMADLGRLLELTGGAPRPLDNQSVDSFYSQLTSLCAKAPFRDSAHSLRGLRHELGDRLRARPFDLNIHPRGELSEYLSAIKSKYSLVAATFRSSESSLDIINRIWDDHGRSLSRLAASMDHEERRHKDTCEVGSKRPRHITCCFFGSRSDQHGDVGLGLGPMLDSQMVSNMEIFLSLPYIGRSYSFQVSYLIYIHDWDLALLTVVSRSELLEIPSNECHYDILVSGRTPPSSTKWGAGGMSFKTRRSNMLDESSVLLSSLLPFRKDGHSHITLFSKKFKPLISNLAIHLFKEGLSNAQIGTRESGVITLDLVVDELPLRGILNDGLAEEQSGLDPTKALRIVAISLWDERLVLRGDLEYL